MNDNDAANQRALAEAYRHEADHARDRAERAEAELARAKEVLEAARRWRKLYARAGSSGALNEFLTALAKWETGR